MNNVSCWGVLCHLISCDVSIHNPCVSRLDEESHLTRVFSSRCSREQQRDAASPSNHRRVTWTTIISINQTSRSSSQHTHTHARTHTHVWVSVDSRIFDLTGSRSSHFIQNSTPVIRSHRTHNHRVLKQTNPSSASSRVTPENLKMYQIFNRFSFLHHSIFQSTRLVWSAENILDDLRQCDRQHWIRSEIIHSVCLCHEPPVSLQHTFRERNTPLLLTFTSKHNKGCFLQLRQHFTFYIVDLILQVVKESLKSRVMIDSEGVAYIGFWSHWVQVCQAEIPHLTTQNRCSPFLYTISDIMDSVSGFIWIYCKAALQQG